MRQRQVNPIVMVVADSPFGPARIAAGANGVVAVELLGTAEGFAAGLARRGFGPAVPLDRARDDLKVATSMAAQAQTLVNAMLEGEPSDPGDVPIDIDDRPAWDRLVLEAVRAIPRGHTAAYGEVAQVRIGRPGAARAVGGAVVGTPSGC